MGTLTFADIKTEVLGFHAGRDDFTARIPNIINLAQMRIARMSVFEELNTTLTDDLDKTASISVDKVYTLPTNLRNIYAIKVYEGIDNATNTKVAALLGHTVVFVDDASAYNPGDIVNITMDNGSIHKTTVTSSVIAEIQFTDALTDDVASGNLVTRGNDGDRYKKLVGLSSAEFDKKLTKPEKESRNMPSFYHRWGNQIETYPIVDKTYKIDVRYSAWPLAFTTDSQTSDLDEKDDAIITLSASWMFMSLKKKEDANFQWTVYRNMMKEILGEDRESPDISYGVPKETTVGKGYDNPFVRSMR